MPEGLDRVFTPGEIAELLRVSEQRVQLWTEMHTLPTIQTPQGRRVRIIDLGPFAEPLLQPDVFDDLCP